MVNRLLWAAAVLLPAAAAQTSVSLSTTPNPSVFGAPVVLTATVTAAGTPASTGAVTFYDGVTVLATKSLTFGTASISTIALPAGTRKLRAYYNGTTSNVVTQAVNAQPIAGFAQRSLTATATQVLATADFNHDGNADLVTYDSDSGNINVLAGDGAANFQALAGNFLARQLGIDAVAIADFNGDGNPDLAVPSGSSAYVLLGKGDGTFQTPATFSTIETTRALAAADFNGDGKADLVATNPNSGNIEILLGKGDGTFQAAVASHFLFANGFINIAIADFNVDGRTDIIATNNIGPLGVLLGNGDGTFQPANAVSPPDTTQRLLTADLNHDGKPDLITDRAVLLGKGDGTFQAPINLNFFATAVSDFNGDGNLDLLLAQGLTFSVLYGKGDGTFQPAANFPVSSPSNRSVIGDFNRDGKVDIAGSAGGAVNLYLGTTVTVTPVTGTPQSTAAGTVFPTPLQVVVKDGANPVSGVLVTFQGPEGYVSFSSATATTDANGLASVIATASSQRFTYTVTATALEVSTTFTLTNLNGPPATLRVLTSPQSALLGTAFASLLRVRLSDALGVPASGIPVTFRVPSSGASASLSATTVFTDATGTARVTATAKNTRGSYSVTATAAGLSATLSLTNLQPATVSLSTSANPVTFGAPLTLVATIGNPGSNGKVTFYDGVTPLATKPAASGTASLATTVLPAGVRKLTAYYRDDTNFAGGTSNVVNEAVKTTSAAALIAQPPISLPGTPVAAVTGDFNGDGKTDIAYPASVTVSSWWQVDLGASTSIGSVVIWNRTDCCGDRLYDYWVFLSDTPFNPTDTPDTLRLRGGTLSSHQTGAPSPSTAIPFTGAQGRYVRVQLSGVFYLSLAEVQVFGVGTQATTNFAQGKTATQSSTYSPATGGSNPAASSAVDGRTDGNFFNGSVTSTDLRPVNVLTVALGNGDGSFKAPLIYSIPLSPLAITSGDFDGDGIADLAITGNSGIQLFSGNGDGTFRPGAAYGIGGVPVVVGDFNLDGRADLAISLFGHFLFYGNGDGTFGPAVNESGTMPVVVADFNGDGRTDFADGNTIGLSIGEGIDAISGPFPPSAGITFIVAGDFNGDGIIDLAGSSGATTVVVLGIGDGTFQQPVTYQGGGVLAVGDFNGDGSLDLLTGSAILLGNGDGTFQPGPSVPRFGNSVLAIADFNGDGRADVLTANLNGGVTLLLGATSPTLSVTATGGTPQSAAVNTPFAAPLEVTVISNGIPLVNGAVTFTAPTAGASAALSSNFAVLNPQGIARVTATANNIAGSYNVTATYQGQTATFALTNTAAGAASLTSSRGTPQSAQAGTAFATPLEATLKDAGGNPVSGATVTFSAPTVGASAVLSSATAVTNASGVASITATANNTVGSYAVTATASGLSTLFSLTNITSGPVNLALRKIATQSSTLAGFPTAAASSAVDGNTNGAFYSGSVTATDLEANPWWQVDLGATSTVNSVVISNRTDCCGSRLGDYWVFVSNTPFLAGDTPATLQNRAGTFASRQTTAPDPSTTIDVGGLQARYVRVQLSGTDYLSLAEVQVIGTGGVPSSVNLAANKLASQSSTLGGYSTTGASSAVDGNTDGGFFNGSVTATNPDTNAWWQVDLGATASVSSMVVWNRTDCCGSRLNDYWVFISDTPFLPSDTPATLQNRAGTFASHQTTAPDPSVTIPTFIHPCPPAALCPDFQAQGRYVRIQLNGTNYLSLAEVQVFGTGGAPAPTLVSQGKPATQSSTLAGFASTGAGSAVDGITDGSFYGGSVTATNPDANPWWQVDLNASRQVSSVVVWNRTDCCASRLNDYWVFVSDTPFLASDTPASLQNRAATFASHQATTPSPSVTIPVGAQGRYVRVQLNGTNYLSLAEVQIYGQ